MRNTPRNRRRIALILSAGVVALVIAAGGATHYTSQSSFCGSCHEMQPLHSGWTSGSHRRTDCYDCHADQTFAGHVTAKWNGLQQAYAHFTRKVDMEQVHAVVPDRRCIRCHDLSDRSKLGERLVTAHLKHQEAKLSCTVCHLTSGHANEAFVGFKLQSCQECHPKTLPSSPAHHLRRPPCTRGDVADPIANIAPAL